MLKIPFFRAEIGEEEINAVVAVLRSGWLTTGPQARAFEERFADALGGRIEAVSVNSATAGLHLAVEACGIGPGDGVLVPTLTFTATAEVVRYMGADVVLVDVEPGSNIIDLADAERRLTPACKAIMPVHFGGFPCDMEAILKFAARRGLSVIDDAAHALPAHRDGRCIGDWPTDATIFSFYANKTMTTGEGGMLATSRPEIAARARVMRGHGVSRDSFDRFRRIGASWKYDVVAPGFKYNMTDLAAAIGLCQLDRLEAMQIARERAAMRYLQLLADLPLDLPPCAPPGGRHAWHIFPVRVRDDARTDRDGLIAALTAAGIGSSVHYRPLHQMSYWRTHGDFGAFPVADAYYKGAVTLPLFPAITDEEIETVTATIACALT